jgi:serine/threonine protein kinase
MNQMPDRPQVPSISKVNSEEADRTSDVKPEIEGYEITDKLGEGGMGTVWRAKQLSTNRQVALKVMKPGFFGSEKARARFEREVEIAAQLEHPNIARVYESGLLEGRYYYAMELIEGEHLDEYARSHRLTLRRTVELFLIASQAVQYAHQRGVIHRDLKPSNILVAGDGQPHILDFGLAKALLETDSDKTLSIDGDVFGTPAYMSPEQAGGHLDSIDTRTDVYSLGVILFNVLTDHWPYDVTGSRYDVLRNIQEDEPVRPSKIVPHFDVDIEAVLLKTLAKRPDERYQSAVELSHDMKCWLDGLPIVAKSANSLYLLRKLIVRHRYTSTVVTLLLVIILGFSFAYYYLYGALRSSDSQLQKTLVSVNRQNKEYSELVQDVLLVAHFLPAWHSDELEQAKSIAQHFAKGTREEKAAFFLLSSEGLLAERTDEFRANMGELEGSFSDFIIAEYYFKTGHRAEATKYYRRCLSATNPVSKKDLWLVDKVRSRLFELVNKDTLSSTGHAATDTEGIP